MDKEDQELFNKYQSIRESVMSGNVTDKILKELEILNKSWEQKHGRRVRLDLVIYDVV